MRSKNLFQIAAAALIFGSLTARADTDYGHRYNLNNPYKKLLNGQGMGDERLYGTRNFRVVLQGVLYRGGGNNHNHRTNPRDNRHPLPNDGLENLCREGFSTAIYTYTYNWETAVRQKRCESIGGPNHGFEYLQLDPFNEFTRYEILKTIYNVIVANPSPGPVYVHCWNGWHASGFVAAISLMQFCGASGPQAVNYWVGTLDGAATNYTGVMRRIREFQPYSDLSISEKRRSEICPRLETPEFKANQTSVVDR